IKMLKMPRVVLLVAAWARVYTSGSRRKPKLLKADRAVPNSTSTSTKTLIAATFDHDPSFDEPAQRSGAQKGQDADEQDDVQVNLGIHDDGQNAHHAHDGVADGIQGQNPILQRRPFDHPVKGDDDRQAKHRQGRVPEGCQVHRATSLMACSNLRLEARMLLLNSSASMPWMYMMPWAGSTSMTTDPGVKVIK